MKNSILVIFLLAAVVCVHSGVLSRNKRGFLSRTGICPIPSKNPTVADVRLNYFGNPVVFDKPDCTQSECTDDSGCEGDRKCCSNRCGAKVCTSAVRDPDPCRYVRCPRGETCKVRKVKCVMPDCESGDVPALGTPTCIKDPNAPKTPPPSAPSAPPASPSVSAYQTPTYATTYPGCTQPPCQAPMMPAAPAPSCLQPPCNGPAPVMFADDQSQATPLMPEEPQQDMQQPQQEVQQPQMDMPQAQQYNQQPQMDMQQAQQEIQQPQQDAQQPQQDMQQPQQDMQQPQQDMQQPQDQEAAQPQQDEGQSQPNAPLQDLDEPNSDQQQQQQQQEPQAQPMYPQQVTQQQYIPQAQWDKKHKRHAQ